MGALLGFGDGIAQGGGAEHAATGGNHLAILFGRAGMEHLLAFHFDLGQAVDDVAGLV